MIPKAVTVILAREAVREYREKPYQIEGKPLLGILLSSRIKVSETWVSTDCFDIKNFSLNLGCKVIDRPKEISGIIQKTKNSYIL